jgi:hypothetical protein
MSPTVLTSKDLASVRGWRHTIGAAGADITLRFDGGVLRGGEVRGVLNRLSYLPPSWLTLFSLADRDYAGQEMHAFYLSWLHSLAAPKLNPPTPQGLCGNVRHPSAWASLAARAGLPVRRFRQSSDDDPEALWLTTPNLSARTVIAVGAEVIGPRDLVGPYRSACLRLAKSSGCPLLGIDFALDIDGAWRMTTASVTPELTRGGEALVDALATALAA